MTDVAMSGRAGAISSVDDRSVPVREHSIHDRATLEGLTSEEAQRRLEKFGPNATPGTEESAIRRAAAKFLTPVPILLEAAIAIQLFLGEYAEAAIIAVLVVFNAILGFLQEGRAQATIAALKSRLALSASVKRDSIWKIVPAAGIVPGDIIKLSLGRVVAADARILDGSVLLDQSMITGESLPAEAEACFEAYAGALVRRGEAVAEVIATGARTKTGRTAELVRTAHATSSQQKATLQVTAYLALVNGLLAILLIAYAAARAMPASEIIPLALMAVLASVPVALPATFTLATAIGARALAKRGVLPTRLSAVDEAATMTVLCADKTGTLTRNELAVTSILPMPGCDEAGVLATARLASSDGGQDPVDRAVRLAAGRTFDPNASRLIEFFPFDPALKVAEAVAMEANGMQVRAVKGAFAAVAARCEASASAAAAAEQLEHQGYRVLGVAKGPEGSMKLTGLVALSDPPRDDSKACIAQLRKLGVPVVMVTGDAPATAATVAGAVGLNGPACPPGGIPGEVSPEDFAVYAGVLPEDKYNLVKAFQKAGYIVGMCGDGANDAPALRQAQAGIAVSTATDVAKSAAGIVLTEPGLSGILAAITEGRVTFQRILTYTLRSIVHKVRQVLFLAAGLLITGHAILSPMLMVLLMITGDFLAMSSTADNVRPSPQPNAWRIGHLTLAGVCMGFFDLGYCITILAAGKYWLELDIETLRTLVVVTLVFSGQAIFYNVRERRHIWSSMPGRAVLICSVADMLIIPSMAAAGILMAPLPVSLVLGVLAATAVFAFALDALKLRLFGLLKIT